jgi:integrase
MGVPTCAQTNAQLPFGHLHELSALDPSVPSFQLHRSLTPGLRHLNQRLAMLLGASGACPPQALLHELAIFLGRSRHPPTSLLPPSHAAHARGGFVAPILQRRGLLDNATHMSGVPGRGRSLKDIQELAGHSSLGTTQRYIEADAGAQRKIVDLI